VLDVLDVTAVVVLGEDTMDDVIVVELELNVVVVVWLSAFLVGCSGLVTVQWWG
jgi:hypothetical protein